MSDNLNVHATPPYGYQTILYPNVLLLSWIMQGSRRGIVTLDLLNCTDVCSIALCTPLTDLTWAGPCKDMWNAIAARKLLKTQGPSRLRCVTK